MVETSERLARLHALADPVRLAVVDELVNMIMAQRTYEVNARAIRTSDEMMREANNIVG